MGDKTVFHIHNFRMHDAYSESTAGGLSAVCLFLATARDRKRDRNTQGYHSRHAVQINDNL